MDATGVAGVMSHVAKPERRPKSYVVRTELDLMLTDLAAGDPVPSERDLAVRFGVARETVRQALRELLVEGRIRRQGRGTVVSRPKLVQPLFLRSRAEGVTSHGRAPGRLLVAWDDIAADAETARALNIAVGTPVMHLERVLLADGERIGLESTFMPRDRFADLRRTFDPTTSLYRAVRETGVVHGKATERIETVLASPREADLLECTTSLPLLLLHRYGVDQHDEPIERVRALYRGDRIALEARLSP